MGSFRGLKEVTSAKHVASVQSMGVVIAASLTGKGSTSGPTQSSGILGFLKLDSRKLPPSQDAGKMTDLRNTA